MTRRTVVNGASCIDSGWDWAFNSLNQSPCQVAALILDVNVGPLGPGWVYTGPKSPGDISKQCNTVVYSLLSACAGCQDCGWQDWATWRTNCENTPPAGNLGYDIPPGVAIPQWAFNDFTAKGTWDNASAIQTGDNPESSAISTSTTQTSTTSDSTISSSSSATLSNTSSSSAPTNTSSPSPFNRSSRTGAIAGGVVGGLVAVLIVAVLIACVLKKRRKVWRGPAAASGDMEGKHPMVSVDRPKHYDPSDPTTFPDTSTANLAAVNSQDLNFRASQTYHGLPEV
ncbi:uncharacterized protein STEHIDRAFT_155105 [Stereum hirsutum FP-91666 SS1]|uniref:uncharacterized protein n=1 Tax=Stereum hirsutum (strain FP-91666) TaxID=721885 RepID=UPI000441029C|nr:uncharacterized protein STEHIDRAFT_155105 [Stereum hirsutum FP-91666 SS1]EIM87729.1 hypothetical protein STEHIDRAFT_155105 [Stereum hirsutum FP-91666 SS1]